MKRKCLLLFAFLTSLLCVGVICPQQARAQFIGFTSPQTVTQLLATALPCTGSQQIFPIQNLGQTQHYVYLTSSDVATMNVEIDGIDTVGDTFRISDTSTIATSLFGTNPVLSATGYFPRIQVVVICKPATSATFNLSYTGTSSTTNQNTGGYQLAQIDKVISSGSPANTNLGTNPFQPPFSNSFGALYFQFAGGSGPSGSTLSLTCQGEASTSNIVSYVFSLATSTALQTFPMPDSTCPNITITYVSGGASAVNFVLDYIFSQPGFKGTNAYTHITGTTATVIKAGPGTVHSLVVGTSAAGTISLFDLVPASCTATPATNVVSVITEFASATPPPPAYLYDVLFQNGICVKASAAMDITVGYQ